MNAEAINGPTEIVNITKLVANHFNMAASELTGPCRKTSFVGPRFVAFKLCREKGHTLTSIGNAFNRDHTSVTYGCKEIERLGWHPNIQTALTTLRKQLNIKLP